MSTTTGSKFPHRKDGQEHYLNIWPGVGHSALVMIPVTPEIQAQLDAMTVYLREALTDSNNEEDFSEAR
ncbi:hypothetical protein [Nitrososphaera viennensis]|uniref:Uncharacterized protein n=2 Tax=Nitrososphaera viennensis TaxID=1034015 RepID=A0A060HHS1_9ARCH|nr:hypothetical protein [Nitrososphaera viennensis]AIC15108.1 hypothetical protein NVIE_008850 [Nitrososphaera viennensis EN76]UVS70032.1 hypothetical protein NWT39_04405 [Nitrososphaera viennensis]